MSETGQARGNDKCMVLCPEVIHVKWWSVDEAVNPLLSSLFFSYPLLFSLLFAYSPLILSFAPLVGLWLSSVPVVWHAAGDEGTVWRNSAQEVEHYFQVHINEKCKMFVFVLHYIPRKQILPACWDSNGILVAVRASYKLHVTLTFPFLVIRPKGQFKLWDLYTYTYTHTSWFVGNFLVLVLKFYNQPERGSVLKQTSGTFSAPQNG